MSFPRRPTARQARKPIRTSALLSSAALPTLTVRTVDIGLCGLCIIAPANLVTRARCTVLFTLPTRDYCSVEVRLEAAVAHCVFSGSDDGFRVGLQFTVVSAEVEAAIAQYLQVR